MAASFAQNETQLPLMDPKPKLFQSESSCQPDPEFRSRSWQVSSSVGMVSVVNLEASESITADVALFVFQPLTDDFDGSA